MLKRIFIAYWGHLSPWHLHAYGTASFQSPQVSDREHQNVFSPRNEDSHAWL